ncbi:MAG: class I SAM-dependent methyltransferase, partial [Cyclobacteriaceae bacterium]
ISDGDHVLILGGGSGDWIEEIQRKKSNIEITYVEASSKMISLAKKNVYDHSSIEFIHGTQADIPMNKRYDVLIIFFFLDMFDLSSLAELVELLKRKSKRNCTWLVADFVSERMWHTFLLRLMYGFFKIVASLETSTLPDWRKQLLRNGLQCEFKAFYYGGFICSTAYRFIAK